MTAVAVQRPRRSSPARSYTEGSRVQFLSDARGQRGAWSRRGGAQERWFASSLAVAAAWPSGSSPLSSPSSRQCGLGSSPPDVRPYRQRRPQTTAIRGRRLPLTRRRLDTGTLSGSGIAGACSTTNSRSAFASFRAEWHRVARGSSWRCRLASKSCPVPEQSSKGRFEIFSNMSGRFVRTTCAFLHRYKNEGKDNG